MLRNAEKGEDMEEYSAMDPPEAYDKTRAIGSDYENMHSFIQSLMDEHKEVVIEVDKFEKALIDFKESGFLFTKEASDIFNTFFKFI